MINKTIFLIFFVVFLVGCQQVDEVVDEPSIEIISGEPIIEEVDEKFNDGLDDALRELEEIESI